ncbi:unnamed protein product [Penicillium olsonii]|uniref:Protein kinase domain-containing protein n=1 Tax=Penicillium olsonii TaxID=99116 RepID=A0A9W4HLK7_PENOL|nr:unnamed protein product [Penicillium olsonii]
MPSFPHRCNSASKYSMNLTDKNRAMTHLLWWNFLTRPFHYITIEMAGNGPLDYETLLLEREELIRRAEESQKRAEESQRWAEVSQRQAEVSQRQTEESRRLAEEAQRQTEESRRLAEASQRKVEEQLQKTTFGEFLRYCHALFSVPLRVGSLAESTRGQITQPKGKYCPVRFQPWADCANKQREIFKSVCDYLEPPEGPAERVFISRPSLQDIGHLLTRQSIRSEAGLAAYELHGVESHVAHIITELCKIPAAQKEFCLGDGILFDDHGNALDSVDGCSFNESRASTGTCSKPDKYCIHRVNGDTKTLLTAVEYKPPHKLSVANLRVGLRQMEFYKEIIQPNYTPTEEAQKLRYNAARLAGSAVVQQFHVMIQEGLEYSYLTVGVALVLLRVRAEDPTTLYYYLCEPNEDIKPNDEDSFKEPRTAIARILCLCLMSFGSQLRDQRWRQNARSQLPKWITSFSHEHSEIPDAELRKSPPGSEYNSSVSAGTASEWVPSAPASPIEAPTEEYRIGTRSKPSCAPANPPRLDSPGSDPDEASGTRHPASDQVAPSSETRSTRHTRSQTNGQYTQSNQTKSKNAPFCTQRCLLGLQKGGLLDECCPNVDLHRQGGKSSHHLINAEELVQQVRQQLDDDPDDCTPMGECGSYGAPFKITSNAHGYTIVGKGTTALLWGEVSREADIYRLLSRVQGAAVPVFLGPIDLADIYFLHGAGEISHMLLMGWAGEPITEIGALRREYSRSVNDIRSLGVLHQDLRPANLLWNAELGRVLVIDFHRCQLDSRPDKHRGRRRRRSNGAAVERKQPRVI